MENLRRSKGILCTGMDTVEGHNETNGMAGARVAKRWTDRAREREAGATGERREAGRLGSRRGRSRGVHVQVRREIRSVTAGRKGKERRSEEQARGWGHKEGRRMEAEVQGKRWNWNETCWVGVQGRTCVGM